jgi:hypothetical protein
MLPDWDFNGDEAKRRTFIAWVEAELDRFAGLLTARYPQAEHRGNWPSLLAESKQAARTVGRPAEALDAMNGIVWEFGLLRYMFRRYWPSRKRPIDDPASAASIAVARCRRALPRDQRTSDRQAVHRERGADLARKVFEEWERGTKSIGRRQAQLDAAYLDTLPAGHFAR